MLEIIQTDMWDQVLEVLKPQVSVSKRLRSLLFYASTKWKISHADFIDVSVCLELLHQASLILDDVIDNDDYREWNRECMHKRMWGDVRGIWIATHLSVWMILGSLRKVVNFENTEINRMFLDSMIDMLVWQLKDVCYLKKWEDVSRTSFLFQESYRKTSAAFELPFKIQKEFLPESTDNVWLAKDVGNIYQMWDDLQDIGEWITKWTVSLSYPLCYLLDNPKILTSNEYLFLCSLLKVWNMTQEQSDEITEIYRKYAENLNSNAQSRIDIVRQDIDRNTDWYLHQTFQEILDITFRDSYFVK